MKKNLYIIALALVVGFLLSKFMLNQYESDITITTVFSNKSTFYFLELGIFESEEELKEKTIDFRDYIYNIKNDKYFVYIAITKNQKNSLKLQGHFEDIGYKTNVREVEIKNKEFENIIEQYDQILERTEDKEAVNTICNQVLAKYEELVLNENKSKELSK